MKESLLRLLLAICALGLTKAFGPDEVTEAPFDYNGAERSFCSKKEHISNQPPDRQDTSLILRLLRLEMRRTTSDKKPQLDGYIITSDDEHQSESVEPRDMRREYVTGFYGSAGDALVTLDKAVFWTDGRYHIQADQQLDCNWMLMQRGYERVPSITEWLKHEFRGQKSVRIGADPVLVSAMTWETWYEELEDTPIRLVPIRDNLVDLIWKGRPSYNTHAAYPLPDKYSGQPWQEKVRTVRLLMQKSNADALVVTALDEIAWLFNIRGSDLPYIPVLRSYAIITDGSIHLYAPRDKVSRSVDTHLKMDGCTHANCVKLHNYTAIWNDLRTMSQIWNTVWLPSYCGYTQGVSMEVYNSIPPEKRMPKASPILNLRAQKNKVEARGMRRAHLRDAAVMCEFLSYLEEQYKQNPENWDEMEVVRLVNEMRYEQNQAKGISFPTIAGYGAHGAIPHYEPNNLTNVKIGKTSTLVVDSGGQYLDGTTDITRTLHFGEPTLEHKKAYTRVLIGSIELSSLTFPNNARSDQLDVVARKPLWNVGYNYMHGTGHGIGHFLSVHESPISVSYSQPTSLDKECGPVQLKPGFFLSNEPGYYKEGDFGVRLENIIEVIEAHSSNATQEKFLRFREVTLVPYEPKLIDMSMLNPSHKRWLNNYNCRIRKKVGPELKRRLRKEAFDWMMEKTQAILESDMVDEECFFDPSDSSSSTFRQFHLLVFITLAYHIAVYLPCIGS